MSTIKDAQKLQKKNLVVNCRPDVDRLTRHIPTSEDKYDYHSDHSYDEDGFDDNDDEDDDADDDDDGDDEMPHLSSLTLQVTGPVVRQVIPSLCSISQWKGC